MSSVANWTYTETLTIWKSQGEDRYSEASYGEPFTIQGDWQAGGEMLRSDAGDEFAAKSIYYIELADDSANLPVMGDMIAKGDHSGTSDPLDVVDAQGFSIAEEIKMVTGWNMEFFGSSELPDWKIAT